MANLARRLALSLLLPLLAFANAAPADPEQGVPTPQQAPSTAAPAPGLPMEEIRKAQIAWAQVMSDHIAQWWARPPGLPKGLRCKAAVVLIPNGEVVSATISVPSSNAAFDGSVLNAIYKASPLPLPVHPDAFNPQLAIWFEPETMAR